MPAILNAANEVAVDGFLRGKLQFLDIPELVFKTMEHLEGREFANIDDFYMVDAEARRVATDLTKNLSN